MYSKPKKKLGQNFLFDKNLQRKIISACQLEPGDTVLEIGSGNGELTRLIAPLVKAVYAVEIDTTLCKVLGKNLAEYPDVKIVNRDILKLNLKRFFNKSANTVKVIGNIPYYITTPIIQHLLKYPDKIDVIFITVQKEFANRMVAVSGSKSYGSLSCFIQYFAEPKILFFIKKSCFFPMPKIDSCFLRMDIKRKSSLNKQQEKIFFQIIRAAFGKRRKMLRNGLAGTVAQEKLKAFLTAYNIDSNIRPERLTIIDFMNLVKIVAPS